MAYNYTILMATYLKVVSDPDPGVRTAGPKLNICKSQLIPKYDFLPNPNFIQIAESERFIISHDKPPIKNYQFSNMVL